MKKRLIVILALVLCLAMVLAGCNTTEPPDPGTSGTETPAGGKTADGEKIKIGVTLPNLNIPHWVNMKYQFELFAEANNCDLTFVHSGGYEGVEKQINQIQDFVAAKMDAIIVAAVDAGGVTNAIDAAVEAGIPVIEVNNLSNSENAYIKIKSDDYEMGRLQAEMLAEALGGSGKVVMINAPGGTTLAVRGQGFRETVEANYPDIEILAEQFVASDAAACTATMEDFVQTYPEIDGVFCWSETAGVCSSAVVSTQGKDIIVTAMDITNPDMRSGIRSGAIYGTVAQQPLTLAQLAMEYAVKAANGESVDNSETLYAPISVITSENIEDVDYSGILRPDETW